MSHFIPFSDKKSSSVKHFKIQKVQQENIIQVTQQVIYINYDVRSNSHENGSVSQTRMNSLEHSAQHLFDNNIWYKKTVKP